MVGLRLLPLKCHEVMGLLLVVRAWARCFQVQGLLAKQLKITQICKKTEDNLSGAKPRCIFKIQGGPGVVRYVVQRGDVHIEHAEIHCQD